MSGGDELVYAVWLQETGLNPRKAAKLALELGPRAVWESSGAELQRHCRLNAGELKRLEDRELQPARTILDRCRALSVTVLSIRDEAYPKRLREIYDPPLVLYVRGKLPDLNALPAIAVVGQRKATAYGLLLAEKLGFQLSQSGVCVVSGMAAGIDSAAHRGALQGETPTVAVFGTAIDHCYPASNTGLLRDILYQGAAISEYPPGKAGHPSFFPRRNRIISGLSLGVVVAEAPMKSGSLITAELALEQGRDVFAVPGGVDVPSSEGCNDLIANGAKLVRSAGDILEEYAGHYAFRETPEGLPEVRRRPQSRASAGLPQPAPKAAPEQDPVLAALEEPLQLDEISRRTGIPVNTLLSRLTLLELKGRIRQLPGQTYEKI